MAENTTQAKHLTSLDCDIDRIPNQLESISKMVDSYAEQIQESFNKKVQFNPFSNFSTASSMEGLDDLSQKAKTVGKQINEAFAGAMGGESVISQAFSPDDIEKAKQGLTEILSLTGRISNLRITSGPDDQALQATVTTIDSYGRRLTETFRYISEPIEDATEATEQFRTTWVKHRLPFRKTWSSKENNTKNCLLIWTNRLNARKI